MMAAAAAGQPRAEAAAHCSDAVATYVELSAAIAAFKARGLSSCATWAAEQLVGLPPEAWEAGAAAAAAAADAAARATPEHPRLVQGRCLLEAKEYVRAAHVLSGLPGPVATFLRCHALFLAGSKQKEQARLEAGGPLGAASTTNPYLDAVAGELEAAAAADGPDVQGSGGGPDGPDAAAAAAGGDPFLAYLGALLEVERGHQDEARALLLAAVNGCPCLWAAWQALVRLTPDLAAASHLPLPASHWASHFFLAALALEHGANGEALSRLQLINQRFPGSEWVASSAALAHYNARNFDTAAALYEDLLASNPWRLQGMDTYSNILFVQEASAQLAHLAHRLAATDKASPEAACVIGNYFSLKGQHARAVEWFRRALRLSPSYLSAWTLMGHEYLELQNAPAAIDAYRRAVALNGRDYRAWYGLGQTYELLAMPHYALHYYRRAALLRPSDPRMWAALGQCYMAEGLAAPHLALRCYRRAMAHGDREGVALSKLAKLHEAQGERAAAAHYHTLNLARLDAEEGGGLAAAMMAADGGGGAGGAAGGAAAAGPEAAEALLFLAEYHRDCGALAEAEACCSRLLDAGGPAGLRAKAILRELRSHHQAAAAAATSSSAAAAAAGSAPGTAAAAAAARLFGGTPGSSGGGGGRLSLGARRVLGGQPPGGVPFGGYGGSGEDAPSFGLQQQQQTPGGLSMVMDDDDGVDDDEASLDLDLQQQQYQQQQQQGGGGDEDMATPAAAAAGAASGPRLPPPPPLAAARAPPASRPPPSMAGLEGLLLPGPQAGAQQQQQRQQAWQQQQGAALLVTPPSAFDGGRAAGGRGGGVAAALFVTPPAAAADGAGGPPASGGALDGGGGGGSSSMVGHLMATAGVGAGAAAAALEQAGGDLVHALLLLERRRGVQ